MHIPINLNFDGIVKAQFFGKVNDFAGVAGGGCVGSDDRAIMQIGNDLFADQGINTEKSAKIKFSVDVIQGFIIIGGNHIVYSAGCGGDLDRFDFHGSYGSTVFCDTDFFDRNNGGAGIVIIRFQNRYKDRF